MRDPRLALAVAALAGLLVGAQAPWWTVTFTGLTGAQGSGTVTGAAGTGGLASVLPSVALAALLATLMLRRLGTRVMAVAAALVGSGMAVLGFSPATPVSEAVQETVQGAALATMTDPVATAWPIVYGVLGVGVAAASAWLFARPPVRRRGTAQRAADVTDPLEAWKAMDAGEDPTRSSEEPGDRPAPGEGERP
ncbi:Trp biosynthesis-associated membrane protein [Propioniciclava coleopterorum]|uniref:Trp biosynthesis-associated membrane protein n=1 Tax=Propioniciclava coleopterorum TaxID=2714937 RepID=A0A6G7YAE4_9ACTN|nr:Trp biosynthesis-associated membrane protein [Propioniciclava coleopterorum]QIK73608.1 Trp biosynthesis-associated membrane protein [Propioniciclava coleopterorum]